MPPDEMSRAGDGLAKLGAEVRRDLERLCYPPPAWVPPAPGTDCDVLVVGAGMCGLTAAFALLRRGIDRLRIVDRNPAGREGPWVTYARMQTLRSPKHLAGPAMGLPSLTFRAWYEAQWGEQAWHALGKIPRPMWMDYLRWYREVLALPVENEVEVERIEPPPAGADDGALVLTLRSRDGVETLRSRKVVVATGREGLAQPRVPAPFRPWMGDRCQHSAEAIDFDALRGRRVAVVGQAASAVDNAAAALEAGAREVHLLARSPAVPRINKAKSLGYAGFTEGFPDLADEDRLRFFAYVAECGVAAPRDSVLRMARHAAFRLHLGVETRAVSVADGPDRAVVLDLGDRRLRVDHVILGTGFRIDLAGAPELAGIAPRIARWRDRVPAGGPHEGSELLDFPYLGPGLEFLPRRPGDAPFLASLYCFSLGAQISHGNVSSDIPAVSEGAERLGRAIARDLFLADAPTHWANLLAYEEPELLGDEMTAERWWPPLD